MIAQHNYRLKCAEETFGVEPINFDRVDDPAQYIVDQTAFRGMDANIDAVGFEAKLCMVETMITSLKLEGSSGPDLRQCIAAARRGGIVNVPGVYGCFIHAFLLGDAFDKGLSVRKGQTHVQRFIPELL